MGESPVTSALSELRIMDVQHDSAELQEFGNLRDITEFFYDQISDNLQMHKAYKAMLAAFPTTGEVKFNGKILYKIHANIKLYSSMTFLLSKLV